MFSWGNNELNNEQSEAILNEKNVLLLACPGSGKTRTLTYKVAYELSKLNNSKQHIIAITYTNRAANEIKERIELLGVDTKQLWIGTIHSFCLEWIIKPYSLYVPELRNGFRVVDSFESEIILSSICDEYNEENGLTRRERITIWDCQYFATPKPGYFITSQSRNKFEGVKNILKRYLQILKRNNQIDFENILFYSLKLLKEKEVTCSILSKIIPYILVDEYQDTKEIQYHIIGSVLSASQKLTKLFIVGDPNQSIFQNLGAYPIELVELEKLTGLEIEKMELSKNYRSSDKIIQYFNHFKCFDNGIIAFGDDKDYNSIITLNKTVVKDDLIIEIAQLIKKSIEEFEIQPEEICIAAPQWVHIASVTRKLMVALPDYSFDGPGMAPFSRDIENFWFKMSRIILTEPSPNLYVRRLSWSREILKELDVAGVNIGDYNSKRFLKLCNSILCDESDGLEYLKFAFNSIARSMNFEIKHYRVLDEHFEAFFQSSQNRIERLKQEGIEFIDKIESFKKVFKQRKGITVSTIHGIKGAEFDTMISFALLQDYIPHFTDRNGVENSKKMLYVIASRARKHLHLIAEKRRFRNYGNPPAEYVITEHLRNYRYEYDEI